MEEDFEGCAPEGTSCQRRASGQTIPNDALDMRRQASIRVLEEKIDTPIFQTIKDISRYRWAREASEEALKIGA
jgi:hypothetical protein